MKRVISLIAIVLLIGGSAIAKDRKFRPAIIVMTDGKKTECMARYPDGFGAKSIIYHADNVTRKKQKMKSDNIRTIHYYIDDERWVELDHYPVIAYNHLNNGKNKRSKPVFLNVAMRGAVTLYKNVTVSNSGNSTMYCCKRENEEFASNLSMGRGIYFKSFRKVGGDYFADSPTIAEKIRNDADGYTPANIERIVIEYNAEKSAN